MEITHLNCFEGPEGTYRNKENGKTVTLSNRTFQIAQYKKRTNSKKTHVGSYYAYDVAVDGKVVETQVMLPNITELIERID